MLKHQTEAEELDWLIASMVSLGEHMADAARRSERETIARCGQYLGQAIQALRSVSQRIDQEQPQITLNNFCRTLECSLLCVLAFQSGYAMKCEFELLPILQELRLYFYYWGLVFPDPERIRQYRAAKMKELTGNRYLDRAEAAGQYRYDLTITIQGYNHLEDATRQCLTSLFQHLPGNLNYELVLVNNGSSDGTKEFFAQFRPTKQLDPAINYGGRMASFRVYEGRYVLAISNDVFLLHHSLRNMLRCMDSDPEIAYLVPQTSNISNLQTLGITCDCRRFTKAAEEYARQNNRYDPYRHIQRSRLCNPLSMFRAREIFSSEGVLFSGFFYAENMALAFPDDAYSILVNRMGKKNVLQKDAFCYHMGQVTIKDDIAQAGEQEFYTQGRQAFRDGFGVDPWGTGCCFDLSLLQKVRFFQGGHVDILGVNSGLGDNPLQIKECYKEYLHNTDVTLYCVYESAAAGQGMAGVADVHTQIASAAELQTVFPGIKFRHILFEDAFSTPMTLSFLMAVLSQRLTPDGSFAVRLAEQELDFVRSRYPKFQYFKGNAGIWMTGRAYELV